MKELVGYCSSCKKEVFCLDGFLNGIVIDKKGTILCFDCNQDHKPEQSAVTCELKTE